MSGAKCEGIDTESFKCEADGAADLTCQSITFEIQFHRSLEYSLQWKTLMPSRGSSRPSKPLKLTNKKKPIPIKGVNFSELRGQGWLKKNENVMVTIKERGNDDILDCINNTREACDGVEESAWNESFKITDSGLDYSDEDAESICSGHHGSLSLYDLAFQGNQNPTPSLCSACQKRYKNEKEQKAPIKSKLLDNDPESLSCDQWVLVKRRPRRRLPYAQQSFLSNAWMEMVVSVRQEAQPSVCSRPHIFLKRNLRCVQSVERKVKRKKRRRNDSPGPRVAKQHRLLSKHPHRDVSVCSTYSNPKGGRSSTATHHQADKHATVQAVPSLDKVERRVQCQQKRAQKTSKFTDLLAQLRGSSSSTIVREML